MSVARQDYNTQYCLDPNRVNYFAFNPGYITVDLRDPPERPAVYTRDTCPPQSQPAACVHQVFAAGEQLDAAIWKRRWLSLLMLKQCQLTDGTYVIRRGKEFLLSLLQLLWGNIDTYGSTLQPVQRPFACLVGDCHRSFHLEPTVRVNRKEWSD